MLLLLLLPAILYISYLILLLLLPAILYISYLIVPTLAKKKPTTHGLRSHPLLGHLHAFLKNRHRFLDWSTDLIVGSPDRRMGFWIPGMITCFITGNPADVEHILRTNFANYPKGDSTIRVMADFLGHGIFNSDGEQWLWQRKSASREFTTHSLRGFVIGSVQSEVRNRLLPLLRRAGASGGHMVLDMQDVLERFAFDTVCMISFGHDPLVAIDSSETCAADGTLPDGTHVGAGWSITYNTYAMGWLATIWGMDCAEFKPERWLDDDGAFQPVSPFLYTVFHAGPRTCLGKEMAYVQMKSIVAGVLEEFVVDVMADMTGSGVPEHSLSITLRMKGGLPVQIRRRLEA